MSPPVTAPENPLLMSEERTFELLNAKAAVDGDRFMVRIFRKKGLTGLGENLAMFANATIEQLSQPEPWVSRLSGGGEYSIQIAHMTTTATRIGGFLKFKCPGEQLPVRPQALQDPAWEGPQVMTYPVPGALPQGQPPGTQRWGWGDNVQPIGGQQLPVGFGAYPVQTQQAPGVPADALYLREQAALAAHTARERELANREAALQKQLTEREEAIKRAELEQRMRNEAERARAEATSHTRMLEEKLNRLLEVQSQPKQDSGGLDKVIAAIAAAVTPIATALLAGAAESRATSQRIASEAAQQHNTLLTSLLNKPPQGLPPEVTMLFEMQKNQSAGSAEMMSRIVEVMGASTKSSVSLMEAMADMMPGGDPGNPMIDMVKETVKAISMLSQGAKEGAKKQIAAQQRQQQGPQQTPAQANPGNSQQNGHQPGQNQNAAPGSQATPVGATATGPQQPQQAAQPANGLQEAQRTSIEELERLIKNRYEPIEKVAEFFITAVKNKEPVMRAALDAVNGEVSDLMQEHLGDWIDQSVQNFDYINRLAAAVDVAGIAAGVFAPDEPEEMPVPAP